MTNAQREEFSRGSLLLHLDTASFVSVSHPSGPPFTAAALLEGWSRWGWSHVSSQKCGFPGPACHWLSLGGAELALKLACSLHVSNAVVLPRHPETSVRGSSLNPRCGLGGHSVLGTDYGDNYFVVCAASRYSLYLGQNYRIPSPKPRGRAALWPMSSSPGVHVLKRRTGIPNHTPDQSSAASASLSEICTLVWWPAR